MRRQRRDVADHVAHVLGLDHHRAGVAGALPVEELTRGAWRFQLGGRYESQDATAESGEVRERSFDGLSGSIGIVWQPGQDYSLGLSLAQWIVGAHAGTIECSSTPGRGTTFVARFPPLVAGIAGGVAPSPREAEDAAVNALSTDVPE